MRRIALICFIFPLFLAGSASADSYYFPYREYISTVKRAQAAYQLDDFEEAHRLGLKCAQMGDKNCQWILGILYLKGSGVKQDGLEGLAWMTVAVESEKEEWVEIYDKVMEQLPAETRAVVEQAGRKYIELYGMSAQNVYCTRRADTGSHIARVVCNKQRW